MELKEAKILFGKSGNKCAFPGCDYTLIDENNNIMCEMAHIEAKSDNGPRANKSKTLKERNKAENLICFCYNHHKLVDKYKDKYTVEVLKKMKKEHEDKFAGTYMFDYDKIFKINDNLKLFMKEMQIVNEQNDFELKRTIKTNRKFPTIVNEIKKDIKSIEKLNLENLEYFETLNERIIEKMKYHGYDTKKWEDELEFTAPQWEYFALDIPNGLNEIKIDIVQVEILYYTEYLKTHDDEEAEELLKKAKKEFEKLCRTSFHYD